MALKTGISVFAALITACGGMIESESRQVEGASASPGANASEPAPSDTTKALPEGAVGLTPCNPVAVQASPRVTKLGTTIVKGRSDYWTYFAVDVDPSGATRAFVSRANLLERHAVTPGPTAGSYFIDYGMPNAMLLTATSIQGAGQDGRIYPISPDDDMFPTVIEAQDSPEALAYGQLGTSTDSNELFVLAPVSAGVLQIPRVFYGPHDKVQERRFISFTQTLDATHFNASAVTFELDLAPKTMPTTDMKHAAGLIDGWAVTETFLCY
jgi:hypothetical protein